MRLGQLARKYDLKQSEVIQFLNQHDSSLGPFHSNTKLGGAAEELIIAHFNSTEDPLIEKKEHLEVDEPLIDDAVVDEAPEIDNSEEIEATTQQELDPTLPPLKIQEQVQEPEKADEIPEENIIETDKLIELLESEENIDNLVDIKLIKAPKKELDGLKIVGKIDLPDPKPKKTEKADEPISKVRAPKRKKQNSNSLSDEEKEERRLKFKKRREKYEAQQAKLKKEKEQKEIKAQRKARYEKNIAHTKPLVKQNKDDSIPVEKEKEIDTPVPQQPKPKTVIGKFWRWLDASER